MKIYLLGDERFEGVENIKFSEIKFFDFKLDFEDFDALIFSSKNAALALEKMLAKNPKNKKIFEKKIYAVGEKSAAKLAELGFKNILIPSAQNAKGMRDEFHNEWATLRCCYLRGMRVAFELGAGLAGWEERVVYERIFREDFYEEIAEPGIFILPSILAGEHFLRFHKLKNEDQLIAIGPRTAAQLGKFLPHPILTPARPSLEECVRLASTLLLNPRF